MLVGWDLSNKTSPKTRTIGAVFTKIGIKRSTGLLDTNVDFKSFPPIYNTCWAKRSRFVLSREKSESKRCFNRVDSRLLPVVTPSHGHHVKSFYIF
jgi:hypothetical protein